MIISDTAIKYRPAVLAALIFLILGGIYCYFSLPRESTPDITIPYVFITTTYDGVAPEEIESLVTIQIEKKIKGLDNVKEISSVSLEGSSQIVIEFFPEEDIDSAVQKVKDKIDLARQDLPDDIDEPIVNEINLSTDIPILSVAFFSSDNNLLKLKDIAEEIKDQVETVPGILEANVFGAREREIRIEVDLARINAYRLPVVKLVQMILNENTTVSAGNIDMSGGKFQIRVPGEFKKPSELKNLILITRDREPIYLSDVATIKDTFKDLVSVSRIHGQACVSLQIQKRSGENIIEVTDKIKKILAHAKTKFPKGVGCVITSDLSTDTHQMIYELENNIITGLILVLLVLLLVMGLRNSFFVAMAIPLSMLISFIILTALGITLNMVVLFSLILALGMLVDNAIVIVESVYRHRGQGEAADTAARNGTSEVAWPVITSTLTTLCAFFPLMFWPDLIGEYMSFLPKTLVVTLSASLFVAIVINPALCSLFIRAPKKRSPEGRMGLMPWLGAIILTVYEKILSYCLCFPKIVLGIAIWCMILTVLLYSRYQFGVELFPDVQPRRAQVNLNFPEGTDIKRSNEICENIEKRLMKYADVSYALTTVGEEGPHKAKILAEFKEISIRSQDSRDLVEAFRLNINGFDDFKVSVKPVQNASAVIKLSGNDQRLDAIAFIISETLREAKLKAEIKVVKVDAKKNNTIEIIGTDEEIAKLKPLLHKQQYGFPGVEIIVDKEQEGPPTGAPISIELSGDDFNTLGVLTEEIKSRIKPVPGLTDLRDNYEKGKPELRFVVDRDLARLLGLNTAIIASFIRTAIYGIEASKYRVNEEEYDITIRLPEKQRKNADALLQMRIPIEVGHPIDLASVGRFEYAGGYGTINRKNQRRAITIEADITPGYSSDEVLTKVKDVLKDMNLPSGYILAYRGDQEDQQESLAFLSKAFCIAIVLISVILILQFNSVVLPAIILISVLLSFIGVLNGLLICGMRFSIIMTGLGIVSLAGIVVNNAIVLIDCIEKQRLMGRDARQAAILAGKIRLRPVLLTAVTTILGLVPMAVGWSVDFHSWPPEFTAGAESSQWWRPMAVVVIFGLLASTVMTLIVIPATYTLLETWRERVLNFTKKHSSSD